MVKRECTVHFLDPKHPNRTEIWPIGDDGIDVQTYEKFKDESGNIYAMIVYKEGEPNSSILRKHLWLEAKKAFDQIEHDTAHARDNFFARHKDFFGE